MESGSSSLGRGRGKTGQTRRIWSNREEEVLIAALKELVATGWKGDNGFRVGYLRKLEERMKIAFPGTDLRGQPHINSRITTWKKIHGSLTIMLSRTGVGFNSTTKMIDCRDNQLWEAVVKNDPNAINMRNKSYPLFDDWKEVFGKDKATGESAEDVMDAVNEMINEDNMTQANVGADYNVDLEDMFDENQEQEGNSVNQGDKGDPSKKCGGKKRKSVEGTDGLYELVGQLCRNTEERLDNIARYIGYEYELGAARKQVFDLLGNIPGLTLDEKLDVSEILASKTDILEMFTGLPSEARAHYVRRLLSTGKA